LQLQTEFVYNAQPAVLVNAMKARYLQSALIFLPAFESWEWSFPRS